MINDIVELAKSVHMHSLQHLAAMKALVFVCESEAVQNMLRGFRKPIDKNSKVVLLDSQWKILHKEVKRKLNQNGVPDLIIDLILENLWPIGFEIFKWIVHLAEDANITCSSNYCWTPQFNIDYVKTAEILVKNEALDIKHRFKLACFHCLDSEVRCLWEEMSLSERRCFFMRGNLKISNQNPIVLYWTYYIQEVQLDHWGSKILNHTHLLKYAVQNGYLSATKYFLDKLKISVRNKMIRNCLLLHMDKLYIRVKEQLPIACFLFCRLPFDDFMPIYLNLLYFLEWPMQKYFMTVVNRVRRSSGYFSFETSFTFVLEAIIEKDLKDFKDYDYKALFIEFWHQFPEYKTYVGTDSKSGFKIIMKFVKKHFGFVFEENAFAMKSRFRAVVFQQDISENERYFEKGNVDFFKFLILERVATRSVIERLVANGYFQEYSDLPMGELMHLIDEILKTV